MREFHSLTPERVWKEMERALGEPYSELFFEFLYKVHGLYPLLPEIDALWWVPQPLEHHPENFVNIHTMMSLQQGTKIGLSSYEKFAILCHDLGKPVCYHARGNLHGHEEAGVEVVNSLCDRLRVPNTFRDLAVKVCRWHTHCHKAFDLTPKRIMKLFEGIDLFRSEGYPLGFLLCCEADARGRLGFEDREYNQSIYLTECLFAAKHFDTKPIAELSIKRGHSGEQVGIDIRCARIEIIRGVYNTWKSKTN